MGRIKGCNGYILIKWAIGGVMMTLHECFIKGRLASRLASPTTPPIWDSPGTTMPVQVIQVPDPFHHTYWIKGWCCSNTPCLQILQKHHHVSQTCQYLAYRKGHSSLIRSWRLVYWGYGVLGSFCHHVQLLCITDHLWLMICYLVTRLS